MLPIIYLYRKCGGTLRVDKTIHIIHVYNAYNFRPIFVALRKITQPSKHNEYLIEFNTDDDEERSSRATPMLWSIIVQSILIF